MAKVTRNWIKRYVNEQPAARVEQLVGRALVALLKRQTAGEQASNNTKEENALGFSASDAKSGSITAKSFIKNGKLLPWQIEKWTKATGNGFPRIAKYARQLNEIAGEKSVVNQRNAYREASRAG